MPFFLDVIAGIVAVSALAFFALRALGFSVVRTIEDEDDDSVIENPPSAIK